MKKWKLKAIIQKLISFLPYKHRINYLFQKYITRGVRLSDGYFEDRLIHLSHHLEFYQDQKGSNQNISTLELGTGWYPVVPIGLFLSGVGTIYTIDISKLMNKERVVTTVRKFLNSRQTKKLDGIGDLQEARWDRLLHIDRHSQQLSFSEILEVLQIRYLVTDARQIPLPDHSIDFITSNNTFEHVYPEILASILTEFKRIIKTDGLMSHFIDMSDHFAHLDQQITIYNFLQFTNQQWHWIDNSIQPQNRWRISHYRTLYQQLGIPISKEFNRDGDIEALRQIKVADAFAQFSEKDLAVSHSYVVSKIEE
ncbi:MAG: hypothetical protein DHS20C18_40100 [Saprospiraceae bacterium]|nr:MAG: hypothetical protein DHS20C18_40100 [Saprospiraceae bacterium]